MTKPAARRATAKPSATKTTTGKSAGAKASAAKKSPPKEAASTADVAAAFTAMLKADQHEQAAARFNAPDIVSREAMDGPMARIQGTAALKAKAEWWYANHIVHAVQTEGPFVNGDQFAVVFTMDVTAKDTGVRQKGREVGLYTVKHGKIVEESFFYGA
jgi:hypothetical protein